MPKFVVVIRQAINSNGVMYVAVCKSCRWEALTHFATPELAKDCALVLHPKCR